MKLLFEESVLGLVGAFCVAAFALGAAWIVLEGIVQLNTIVAGLLAAVAAGATLETISRRLYEERQPGSAQKPSPRAVMAQRRREPVRTTYRRAA
jgi:hypothetical protein